MKASILSRGGIIKPQVPGTNTLIVVRRFLVNFTEARSYPVVICITVVTDKDSDSRLPNRLDI